jgi:hypothetical protein
MQKLIGNVLNRLGLRAGANVGVSVLDTGIKTSQDQFFFSYSRFQSRLPHLRANTTNTTIDDACFHGTKVASVVAAPHDGASVVGIAWNSDLMSVKVAKLPLQDDGADGSNVCNGIRGTLDPRIFGDTRTPPEVIAMAFGMSGRSNTIASCLSAAIAPTTPGTAPSEALFIVAAGSNLPDVVFPASEPGMTAVSAVEIDPTRTGFNHYRKFGLLGTVAYWPKVEFVTAQGDVGHPSSGPVGNAVQDDIARFKWSSAATGIYGGISALGVQYLKYIRATDTVRAPSLPMTRLTLLERMRLSSSGEGIIDATGQPASHVGSGLVNAYRLLGGITRVSISSPGTVAPGPLTLKAFTDEVLTARERDDGVNTRRFTFAWNISGRWV